MSGVAGMECKMEGNLRLFVHCSTAELAEPFLLRAREAGFAAETGLPEPASGAQALLLDAALLPQLLPEQLGNLHSGGLRIFC